MGENELDQPAQFATGTKNGVRLLERQADFPKISIIVTGRRREKADLPQKQLVVVWKLERTETTFAKVDSVVAESAAGGTNMTATYASKAT